MKKAAPVLLFVFLLTGCRSLYVPTTPNVPMMKNGGEFQVESTIFTNGINFKSAFSPVNHLSLQLNGQYTSDSRYSGGPQYHEYLEGAIGGYYNPNDWLFMESYIGYGNGAANYGDPGSGDMYDLTLANGTYNKTYLQFDIGASFRKSHAMLGSCVRVARIAYTYRTSTMPSLAGNTYDHHSVEPYIFFKSNMNRKLSFVTYLGFTVINGIHKTIRTNIVNFGVGLNFKLGRNSN